MYKQIQLSLKTSKLMFRSMYRSNKVITILSLPFSIMISSLLSIGTFKSIVNYINIDSKALNYSLSALSYLFIPFILACLIPSLGPVFFNMIIECANVTRSLFSNAPPLKGISHYHQVLQCNYTDKQRLQNNLLIVTDELAILKQRLDEARNVNPQEIGHNILYKIESLVSHYTANLITIPYQLASKLLLEVALPSIRPDQEITEIVKRSLGESYQDDFKEELTNDLIEINKLASLKPYQPHPSQPIPQYFMAKLVYAQAMVNIDSKISNSKSL